MTELKTLKDIEVHEADEEDLTNNVEWFKQEIKAEAIKWVKTSKKEQRKLIKDGENDKWDAGYWKGFQQNFIDFFNITEEDLK